MSPFFNLPTKFLCFAAFDQLLSIFYPRRSFGGSLYEKPNPKSWNFKRPYSKSGQKTFKAENSLCRKYVRKMLAGGQLYRWLSLKVRIFFLALWRPKVGLFSLNIRPCFSAFSVFMILTFCKEPSGIHSITRGRISKGRK